MGWKDSVNVHTYPKYLLNKSLSTTCVLCSRERRMTCICRWVHCAKQQWYGSLSQLFWKCTLLSHEYFKNKAALKLARQWLASFRTTLAYIWSWIAFIHCMYCKFQIHNGSYHFKMRLISCSGKWFVKQELQVSVNIYWVLSTQILYVKFIQKQQIISWWSSWMKVIIKWIFKLGLFLNLKSESEFLYF